MPRPRKQLVSVEDTPYYHIVSRCVRRSFLCGYDKHTHTDYEHRRQWIVDRIRLLSSIFTIDICAYAVLSNHYHLCVKLDPKQADNWSNEDIAERWAALHKGPLLFQRWRAGDSLHPAELQAVTDMLTVYRKRLTSLSWFMKCLNEPIARQANKEDECTGHFFESRFKSQALRTEEALLSCMTYVDLNPVRAAMADTPETSDYTSIKERITPTFNLKEAIQSQLDVDALQTFSLPLKPLSQFESSLRSEEQKGILYDFKDYLELVDWTGRIVQTGKRGAMPSTLSPILERLNITENMWLENATQFESCYHRKFQKRLFAANSA